MLCYLFSSTSESHGVVARALQVLQQYMKTSQCGCTGEVPEGTPGSDTADEPGKHVEVGGADKEEDLPQGRDHGSAKQS